METITLPVQGMSCGGCVRAVTKVLSDIDGVFGVEVSLEQANAQVSFDPNKVAVPKLQDAVRVAGYETP